MSGSTYRIRGTSAEVMWKYLVAASLESWSLKIDSTARVLKATVAHADTFRLSQPALKVRTRMGVWPIESWQIAGETLTAQLGPQMES